MLPKGSVDKNFFQRLVYPYLASVSSGWQSLCRCAKRLEPGSKTLRRLLSKLFWVNGEGNVRPFFEHFSLRSQRFSRFSLRFDGFFITCGFFEIPPSEFR